MGAERERAAGSGRLEDGLRLAGDWSRRGPYVSERQWRTPDSGGEAGADAGLCEVFARRSGGRRRRRPLPAGAS